MNDYDFLFPLEQFDDPIPFAPRLYHYADNGLISAKLNGEPIVFSAMIQDEQKVMANWNEGLQWYQWNELAGQDWSVRFENILNLEYCYPFANTFKGEQADDVNWETGWGSDTFDVYTYGRIGFPYFDVQVEEKQYQKSIWGLFKQGKPVTGRSQYAIVHLPSGMELIHVCGFKDAKFITFVISQLFSNSGRTLQRYNVFYHLREALYDEILDEYLAFDQKHSEEYKDDARKKQRRFLRRRL